MLKFHLTSVVYRTKGISVMTVYLILSKREGPGPGPLVQNMANIGPRPGPLVVKELKNIGSVLMGKNSLYTLP